MDWKRDPLLRKRIVAIATDLMAAQLQKTVPLDNPRAEEHRRKDIAARAVDDAVQAVFAVGQLPPPKGGGL